MSLLSEANLEIAKADAGPIWGQTILAGTVGSVVHGLNVGESEDLDIMGVCVETIEQVAGLHPFEQLISRTASKRVAVCPECSSEKSKRIPGLKLFECLDCGHTRDMIDKHNARSLDGDVDMTIYGLRKYLRLALFGNPSILTLLFVPGEFLIKKRAPGMSLQALAPHLVSKRAGGAFLGYMQAQRQRLVGERGGRHGVRADRINQFGYDSKYATHIIRLGLQGIELMKTGRITLPMPELEAQYLREIRMGNVELVLVLNAASDVEHRLKEAIDASLLPERPDEKFVERWLIDTHTHLWNIGFSKI